jgi:uncharacterized membrane protein YgdD (TMEM256/DUF423 family)
MQALLAVSAVNGFLAVALGAFGAHGLRGKLANAPDGARRLEWWQTGANYQLAHAVASGLAALCAERISGGAPATAVGAFSAGCVLFSGSLYVMAVTGIRKLGAITPLGGLAFLAGWGSLLWAALGA